MPSHTNPKAPNPELRKAILEIVENQIRDNKPPETRQTIERLTAEGYTAEEARLFVAAAVSLEIFHITQLEEEYHLPRFLWNLARMPRELVDQDGKEFYEG